MSTLRKIGTTITLCKDALGLTTAEIARRSGMGESSISDLRNGSRDAGITKYIAIAKALGITMAQLVGEAEIDYSPQAREDWQRRVGK